MELDAAQEVTYIHPKLLIVERVHEQYCNHLYMQNVNGSVSEISCTELDSVCEIPRISGSNDQRLSCSGAWLDYGGALVL